MRWTCDEIDLAVAQRLVSLVVRKDELMSNIEPFSREEAELDRCDCRKVRV
jgi:hypothetical protein